MSSRVESSYYDLVSARFVRKENILKVTRFPVRVRLPRADGLMCFKLKLSKQRFQL